nr:GntR family transcriptional regulator [Candidatus Pantoea persica]
MEALQLALRAVTWPGDCVGQESPTYFFLFPLLASLGLKALETPTDPQHGLSLDALEMLLQEQRIQALIAMPSAQNPLGYCMSRQNKQRLAKLVNTYKVPLLEDGLYDELQFDWQLSPAVKSFDSDGWVIYCTSFTKTVAPDFRIGRIAAAVGNPGGVSRQRRLRSPFAHAAPPLLRQYGRGARFDRPLFSAGHARNAAARRLCILG